MEPLEGSWSVHASPNGSLVVRMPGDRPAATFTSTGKVTLGIGVAQDVAARGFWQAVAVENPLAAKVRELEGETSGLKRELRFAKAELRAERHAVEAARSDLAGSGLRLTELEAEVARLDRERRELIAGLERLATAPVALSHEAKAMKAAAQEILRDARRGFPRRSGS